jgi:flagellar biosynthesis protein FlhA
VVFLIPLPTVMLDMLLALNLGVTVLLLLITLNAKRPLDISVFPSMLLLMTLYRLSLNVATTRLILLDGDAGRIVATFGDFVVGGNLVVGMVIFLILILIQFIVITKGASRISEVNARFTLDALPGKQMAIDAELGAGSIDETEAQRRRQQLTREAEFYGAMDGAGKYVRGDTIAGLLITVINLVGGVIVGLTNGLTFAQALERYSVLTIGDGLVSQIPALIIATTAGILVTKAASEESLGHEIGTQVLANERPLWIGAAIMVAVALTPGLPKLPFFLIAGGLVLFLRRYNRKSPDAESDSAEREPPDTPPDEVSLDEFLHADRVSLEIGAALVPLVETKRTTGLKDSIASLRRDLTRQHGIWVPPIRLRDNYELDTTAYRVLIAGREVARGEIHPDRHLAIDPGKTAIQLEGVETRDPAFDLPARWIDANSRHRAELGGYTVVDAPTVLVTHLGEVLRRHAHKLLSREDLQNMLDKVRQTAPTIVEELKPDLIRMGVVHQIMIRLLQEQVPITNLELVLEAIAHHATDINAPEELTERVRGELGWTICDSFRDAQGRLRVMILDPRLEITFRESIRDNNLSLQPVQLERFIAALDKEWQKSAMQGEPLALLTDRSLRRLVRRAIERSLPDLSVIAYVEIPNDLMIEPVAMVRPEDVYEAEARPKEPPENANEAASVLPASAA